MGQPTIYNVTIRIMPKGQELELELPSDSTGAEIINELLNHPDLNFDKKDPEGNRYTWQLYSKSAAKSIPDNKTLWDCGVNDGDTILMSPVIVAASASPT